MRLEEVAPPQGSMWLPDKFLHQLMMRERSRLRAAGYNPDNYLTPKVGRNVLMARNQRDIEDMPHRLGGRAKRPKVLAMTGPQGNITFIPGMQVTDAAELQDLMYRTWEREQDNIRRLGTAIPLAEHWHKLGMPQQNEFSDVFKQALKDRVAQHRANPRTDPPRKPGLPLRGWIQVERSISGIKKEKARMAGGQSPTGQAGRTTSSSAA